MQRAKLAFGKAEFIYSNRAKGGAQMQFRIPCMPSDKRC